MKKIIAYLFHRIITSNEFAKLKYAADTASIIKRFRSFGEGSMLPYPSIIMNPQYMSVGKSFSAMYNLRLEAWDEYHGVKFQPELIIGDGVIFNTDCHIGCINKIVIGNNVLMASRIYITDHSHGETTKAALEHAPTYRPLLSKGPVVIEDNVWIGEGVCILSGVTIGANAIIGANAVVVKDVAPNTVVGGIPAKVLKVLND